MSTEAGEDPIGFAPIRPYDAASFAAFLAGEPWPFHSPAAIGPDVIERAVSDGAYFTEEVRTHWIVVNGEHVGVVKAFDLTDSTPLFDLRITAAHRGRGTGKRTVAWLSAYLFNLRPDIRRIEGTTRVDNLAMRSVFHSCGFAKEAHYRDAWPMPDGEVTDAVGYALLRRDWLTGTVTPVPFGDRQ